MGKALADAVMLLAGKMDADFPETSKCQAFAVVQNPDAENKIWVLAEDLCTANILRLT